MKTDFLESKALMRFSGNSADPAATEELGAAGQSRLCE